MLNVFRENLKSLKWLLWITAGSMTLYLGAYFSCGTANTAASTWAAIVDGHEIPAQNLMNMTRSLDQQYRQVFGQNYDQLRQSLQLGTRAIETLIQRELILDDARRLGLRATPEDVASFIREDPSFQGADGQFIGRERYLQLVERIGGAADFEEQIADDVVIRKWEALLGQSIEISQAEIERVFRERTEKTSIRFFVVPGDSTEVEQNVDDTALQGWYDAHRDDYRRGERRQIRYAVVKRADAQKTIQVSDEDIRQHYESNASTYATPVQRQARHILLQFQPDTTPEQKEALRQRAEALLARIQAGEDFDALARSESADTVSAARGGDLGFFGRGQMVPPFDEAVFTGAIGSLTPVVESQFGYHVIEVLGERPAGTTPLEEVRDSIRRTLELQRANDRIEATARQVRDAAVNAAGFAAAATDAGLVIETRNVTADATIPDLGASPRLMATVFETEPGSISAPIPVTSGMVVVAVDAKLPAGIPPLTEITDEVREDVVDSRRQQAALQAAEKALAANKTLDAAAGSLDLEVEESADLTPTSPLPASGGLTAEARGLLFGDGAQTGIRAAVEVPAGALAFEITGREPFDPDRLATEAATLRAELRDREVNTLRQALIERLRGQKKVQINDALVARFDGPGGQARNIGSNNR